MRLYYTFFPQPYKLIWPGFLYKDEYSTVKIAFHFQNLLVVGPGVLIFRDYTKIKTGTRPV